MATMDPTQVLPMDIVRIIFGVDYAGVEDFLDLLAYRAVSKRWKRLIEQLPSTLVFEKEFQRDDIQKLSAIFPFCASLKFPQHKECDLAPLHLLSHLRELTLDAEYGGLKNLNQLPTSLTRLDVMGLDSIHQLDISHLTNLRTLNLGRMWSVYSIASAIRHMICLRSLSFVFGFESVAALSSALNSLQLLETLRMRFVNYAMHLNDVVPLKALTSRLRDLATTLKDSDFEQLKHFSLLTRLENFNAARQYTADSLLGASATYLPHLQDIDSLTQNLLEANVLSAFTALRTLKIHSSVDWLTTQLQPLRLLEQIEVSDVQLSQVFEGIGSNKSKLTSIHVLRGKLLDDDASILCSKCASIPLKSFTVGERSGIVFNWSRNAFRQMCQTFASSLQRLDVVDHETIDWSQSEEAVAGPSDPINTLQPLTFCSNLQSLKLNVLSLTDQKEYAHVAQLPVLTRISSKTFAIDPRLLQNAKFASRLKRLDLGSADELVRWDSSQMNALLQFRSLQRLKLVAIHLPDKEAHILFGSLRLQRLHLANVQLSVLKALVRCVHDERRPIRRTLTRVKLNFPDILTPLEIFVRISQFPRLRYLVIGNPSIRGIFAACSSANIGLAVFGYAGDSDDEKEEQEDEGEEEGAGAGEEEEEED